MKYRWIFAVAAVAMAAQIGCQSENVDRDLKPKGPLNEAQRSTNKAIVDGYEVEHESDAVIRQHTIFPYHFVSNSTTLNQLGWHDVNLLAQHFAKNPGPLNVRKGDTPEVLYKARIKALVDAMAKAGVQTDRIKVTDGLPGGDGISSDQVVMISAKQAQKAGMPVTEQKTTKNTAAEEAANTKNASPSGATESTAAEARTGGQF